MLLGASSTDQLMENIGAIQVSRVPAGHQPPKALEQRSGVLDGPPFVQHIFGEHLLHAKQCPRHLSSISEPPKSTPRRAGILARIDSKR